MKNNTSLSATLGLTQPDAAQILGISTGYLSMIECGQRDLPLEASQKFTELLAWINKSKAAPPDADAERERQLQALLQQNRLRQWRVSKKIDLHRRKYERALTASALAGFTSQRQPKVYTNFVDVTGKQSAQQAAESLSEWVAAELRLEQLRQEQAWIEGRLRG